MGMFFVLLFGAFMVLMIVAVSQVRRMGKTSTSKINSLNTYIDNLSFTPTRICATLRNMFFTGTKEFSQTTLNIISQAMTYDKTKYPNGFWAPELGVFMDVNQKVFAVRSDVNETIPKVYSFSQLQYFEVSPEVQKRMTVVIYGGGIAVPLGGGLKGELFMRVVFNGINGPESVTLRPSLYADGRNDKVDINNLAYKLRFIELTAIADCLQWIHNNA